MSAYIDHPIVTQSFAVIDREMGNHGFTPEVYALIQRVIHATADFDYANLLELSEDAIARGCAALQTGQPIVTDVSMVTMGIQRVAAATFAPTIITALHQAERPLPGKTLTETGLLACCRTYPHGIYVIGNAPTALLALCHQICQGHVTPALVIGAPVGFINVLEAKQALADCAVPQIRIAGRKGGSGVAAALMNALLIDSWRRTGP
ncbi:MAG: precorrin-8X methylmutase [Cyanobacteria bacterium J06632_22]